MPGLDPPPARASWLELGLIPAAAVFVLLTIPNLINQNGMIDPFVYTGFIHSYRELLVRFGRTYYSSRIAFIDPARVLVFLFGDSAGYVLLRFVALAAALGSLWSIARRYYGTRVAAFCLVLFALHPVLVRSLLWDYIDGFAITYLLVSLDSVQSVYLWGYTRLPNVGFGPASEPRLDAPSRKRALETARIVLLGHRQSDIDRMRRALDEAGIATRPVRSDRFEESGLSCFTVVLDRL